MVEVWHVRVCICEFAMAVRMGVTLDTVGVTVAVMDVVVDMFVLVNQGGVGGVRGSALNA
jgi:hypothetical protein